MTSSSGASSSVTSSSGTFSFRVVPRYAEIDQQGVVFHAHYLTWFDEAFTGFLHHVGVPYPELIAGGVDVQVVHTELDYAAPVRWLDEVAVAVTPGDVGTTSFTLEFAVRRRTGVDAWSDAVVGRTVYVCVDASTLAKAPVPDRLLPALGRRSSVY